MTWEGLNVNGSRWAYIQKYLLVAYGRQVLDYTHLVRFPLRHFYVIWGGVVRDNSGFTINNNHPTFPNIFSFIEVTTLETWPSDR